MRQVKWAGLAFFLGSIVVLNPSYSPAQFGKRGGGEGGGGFGKGGFGKGGGEPGGGFGKGGFGKGGGEGGGFGKGGFGKGGFGAPSGQGGAPAAPGGFGAAPAPGGFGAAPAAPGGFGGAPPATGGGFGGGGRGMGGDPNQMWDFMARGQDSINLNDPQHSRTKDRMLQRGEPIPPDGILTRQMFVAAAQQRMAAAGGGAPGAPTAVLIGGGSGGPGAGGTMNVTFSGPMGGGGGEDTATRRIREQDKNGDGKVSLDEADGRLRGNFQSMDKNGDGHIDGDEYRAATGGGGNRDRDRNGGMGQGGGDFGGGSGDYGRRDERRPTEEAKPVAMRYGHLPKDLPKWFDEDDGNKDGQVALHEWRLANKKIEDFLTYDMNGDGLITADEYLRFGLKQAEDARIAAINNPDSAAPPAFASRRGGGGGFALPGSTPTSTDRNATSDRGKGGKGGKGDRTEEKAPDGGFGGPNAFRKGKN